MSSTSKQLFQSKSRALFKSRVPFKARVVQVASSQRFLNGALFQSLSLSYTPLSKSLCVFHAALSSKPLLQVTRSTAHFEVALVALVELCG